MKKAAAILLMVVTIGVTTFAQEHQVVTKKVDKVKRTSTLPQKVHNVFSKHKKYNGTKVKHVTKVEKVKS